jgi:hypothetical protein
MPDQTHTEKLAEYLDAAERHAQSYAGQTQEFWWLGLAKTLREALADRQRIEALANAAIEADETNTPGRPQVWYTEENEEPWEVDALGESYRGGDIFKALDALQEGG